MKQFSGVVQAIQQHWQSSLQRLLTFAAKGIIRQLPVDNVMQQKGSFSITGKRK